MMATMQALCGWAIAAGIATGAGAQTQPIPPRTSANVSAPAPYKEEIPKGVGASTWLSIGGDALEKRGDALLRRGAEVVEHSVELPPYGFPGHEPNFVDLDTPAGKGLKGIGKGLGRAGVVLDAYEIQDSVREGWRAAGQGEMERSDAKLGQAMATVTCMHPVAAGPCMASELASPILGVDVVKWGLQKKFAGDIKDVRTGCSNGNRAMDDIMRYSDACIEHQLREYEALQQQRRLEQQAEFDRIARTNEAKEQMRRDAERSYRSAYQTPADPPSPSGAEIFLQTLNQSLQQHSRFSLPANARSGGQCQIDPKTGCHPGHDEKAHPGGCKCGR